MNRRALLCLAAASACGRSRFDALPDGAPDVAVADGAPAPFDPAAGTCTDAASGPFVEVASFPTQGGGYGVWAAPPYVLIADTTGGVTSVRFDGSTFTQTGHLDGLGWVEAVWSDGATYYVSAPGTGLAVIALDAQGTLTLVTQNTAISEARHGWSGNGTLYVPAGNLGVFAVHFDGSTLSSVGTPAPSMSWGQGVWAKGNRVFWADAQYFRILDFDGSQFTDAITPDMRHGATTRVWSDGTTIFVAHGGGATAFRLQGTTLVELDTFTTATSGRDIWSDGKHLFLAAEGDGLYALDFVNDKFVQLDHITIGLQALGVFGDGTYIYANDLTGGLHAFRGFECTSW